MSRIAHLSRVDIRAVEDRGTGALTLRYTGRKLHFFDRMFGYADGVFFAVVMSEVPLPEALTTLASAVGTNLDGLPLVAELRRAVAQVLVSEATMEAPDYLSMIAEPRTIWLESDARELEHKHLAAENHVRELSRLIENSLRARITKAIEYPAIRGIPVVAPAGYNEPPLVVPPPPLPPPEVEIEEEVDGPIETSESTGKRVLAAVKIAREQELPQRLPGGARRALGRLPVGLYISVGAALERKNDICSAMVAGAESGKRGGEVALIDWDGEWPVVARRYGAHGRIIYRVEEALKRNGIATEAA